MKDKKFGRVIATNWKINRKPTFGVTINLENSNSSYDSEEEFLEDEEFLSDDDGEFVSFQVAEKLYNDLGKALKHLKRKMKENDSNKLHTCSRTNQ